MATQDSHDFRMLAGPFDLFGNPLKRLILNFV
jgi:hypothetical protein